MIFPERFTDQVAIVTGGASGLGKAIAFRLAHEGADVTLFDTNREALDSAVAEFARIGGKIQSEVVDITDEEAVAVAVEATHNRCGRLDIVVNSAGIVGPNGVKVTEVDAAAFDEVYRVNLRGAFLITKHALRFMSPRDYGRVLLIASIAGKEGNAGMTAYSATKSGVIGLVKAVGKEFAETGITVNGLAPAVIRTAMVENMVPEQVKYMTDKIPRKRCGTLEEVAALAAWIVSGEASFNTGFVFDLTGGRAVY